MPTNDFLVFANDPTANVTTQATWLGYDSGGGRVQEGFPSGILASSDANKAWRQSTMAMSLLGQIICDVLGVDALDSGGSTNYSTLLANLKTALRNNALSTGMVVDHTGPTAPTGFVLATGGTIGNASSGGTLRANADTFNLFSLYWNDATGIYTVSGGKGASASADFAANKTVTTPALRGRTAAGADNMGGVAANRLTSAGSGINGSILGMSGGVENITLTVGQMPSHAHTASSVVTDPTHAHSLPMVQNGPAAGTGGCDIGSGL